MPPFFRRDRRTARAFRTRAQRPFAVWCGVVFVLAVRDVMRTLDERRAVDPGAPARDLAGLEVLGPPFLGTIWHRRRSLAPVVPRRNPRAASGTPAGAQAHVARVAPKIPAWS